MSGSASLDLERLMLGHTLAIAPMATLSRVYVALCRTAPTEAAGGEEVTGAGYVRPAATFTLLAVPANAAANATAVDFAPATGDWGTVTHFEIWTQATGGTRLYWGQLVDPADSVPIEIEVTAGNVLRFSPGTLVVQATDMDPVVIEDPGPFLPTAGGTMTGPLLYAATGGIALRPAQDRAADTANVLDFGADLTGATDSTTAINAALATGKPVYMPAGIYRILNQLNVGPKDLLYGDGRQATFLMVRSSFSSSASAVIALTGSEHESPVVRDFTIIFEQPADQGSRANFKTLAAGGTSSPGGTGVMYPPGILSVSSNRFRIERVQIQGAWDGIVSHGNVACWINDVEVGAFNCGLFIGQSRDFVHIKGYHFWNFGILGTPNPIWNVFADGNTFAARFGEDGGCNGLAIEDMASLFGRFRFDNTNTWAHVVNLGCDLGATLEIPTCNFIQITNHYHTGNPLGVNPNSAITVGGGVVHIVNSYAGSSQKPVVLHTGGVLHISASNIGGNGNAVSVVTQSGGQLFIDSTLLGVPDADIGAWTVPIVVSTGGTFHFTSNRFRVRAATPGSIPGISLTTDNAAHYVAGNNFNGWAFTPPAGNTGCYGPNSDGVMNRAFHGAAIFGTVITGSTLLVNGNAGTQRSIQLQSSGALRWVAGASNTAEGGSNAGSDFGLQRFADDGTTLLGVPFGVVRATGRLVLAELAGSASFASDAPAAAGGVAIGQLYRNGSAVMVRVA